MKLKVGHVYFRKSENALLKIIKKEVDNFPMRCITQFGEQYGFKEEIYSDDLVHLGKGSLEDYPEYFL